jgi:glycosyltransferase involved in cell wall biosynthesis
MISVIMGVHRFDEHVPQAIDSIMVQSLKIFEFIVVANGASCDEIERRILEIYPNEKKLRIVKSQIAQLSHALNLGIEASCYPYVARMDADDIAWPDRLERQLLYLEQNHLDMVGCDLRLIDESGSLLGTRVYPKGKSIEKYLSFRNCFAHNTVLIKRPLLLMARGYNSGFNSEDYDLWLRLRRFGVKWDNMSETLVDYRVHSESSQRRLLGYAESTALAVREFVLDKSVGNFFAIFYHFFKSIFRSRD